MIDNVGPGGLPRRPRAHGNEALEYQIPPARRKCLRSLPHHPATTTPRRLHVNSLLYVEEAPLSGRARTLDLYVVLAQ